MTKPNKTKPSFLAVKKTDRDGKVTTYEYDGLNRLVKGTDGDGVAAYTYDKVGNTSTAADKHEAVTFAYDALYRVASVSTAEQTAAPAAAPAPKVTAYAYDNAGNRLTHTNRNMNITRYTYDGLNRLTSTTDPEGSVSKTAYDYLGNVSALTTWGGRDEASTTRYAYDGAGFLTSETSPLGFVSTYQNDPEGNPQSETKTDLNYTGLDNRNNYTGYTWDVTLELYFAQARFYDPENHRFTQEDPIKDGENWYIYVGNMPLVYVDPSGYAIAVGIVLAAQKTMEAALAALLLVAAVYLVSPDGQAAMQDFASALGVAIRDFTTTASDWGGQIEDASIYFQEVSCSLRDAVNTMVVETATNVKERIEPNGQTIYVHYDTTDYKVHYVGRTKDYWRRRNEHARINIFGGYASSHPIGDDLNREMMPIFTGLDQVQARIVEQLLITAFTIQALDNARNEIAEAKWDSAWSELNRVGSLTKDYLDAVKNPIATLIKDIFK